MNKYVLKIDGMRCGMCEAHVEEAIRKAIKVKKIKASHIKNNLVVISEEKHSREDFSNILSNLGYKVVSYEESITVKKFLGWK